MRNANGLEAVPKAAWSMVRLASRRLLVLDYDGTLAPFRVARDDARPIPRSVELLRQIAGRPGTTLAIIAGRPVSELERLVEPLPIILVGENGWEYRLPGEPLFRHPLPEQTVKVLDEAERIARAAGWDEHLERKRTGVVVHTRRLPGIRARDLEHRTLIGWLNLIARGYVVVERIHGGVEIRARGHDAGTTARWLVSMQQEATLGVFVGDGESDESGFQAMRDFGFGIRVGSAVQTSHALGTIPSCESVTVFLEEWIRVTSA